MHTADQLLNTVNKVVSKSANQSSDVTVIMNIIQTCTVIIGYSYLLHYYKNQIQ